MIASWWAVVFWTLGLGVGFCAGALFSAYHLREPVGSPWRSDAERAISLREADAGSDPQRDTPPRDESRHGPPSNGRRSEGSDAATSGRYLVAFDHDDKAGAWLQGQIAEYLGPVPGTDGQVHGFRMSGSEEILDLTDPFGRGLVHRVGVQHFPSHLDQAVSEAERRDTLARKRRGSPGLGDGERDA